VNYRGSKCERLDRIETILVTIEDKLNTLATGDPATVAALQAQIASETAAAQRVTAALTAEDQQIKAGS
jgi:hypothetical protein